MKSNWAILGIIWKFFPFWFCVKGLNFFKISHHINFFKHMIPSAPVLSTAFNLENWSCADYFLSDMKIRGFNCVSNNRSIGDIGAKFEPQFIILCTNYYCVSDTGRVRKNSSLTQKFFGHNCVSNNTSVREGPSLILAASGTKFKP